MTEYTKGQRVRVLRDSTTSHIEPGIIVTLVEQDDDEFWAQRGGKFWRTNDTRHFKIGAVVSEDDIEPVEPPVGSIVRFANGVYAYRVRRGYTDEFPADHDWRTLYSDGSTGLDTWESAKRYAGDDSEFEVVHEGGQVEDFQDLE